MRFWDTQDGSIKISDRDIKKINTENLRRMESYVTQETYLFHDSIANNIAVGKSDADRERSWRRQKKLHFYDFIMTLPKGYDTGVGELGDTLSGENARGLELPGLFFTMRHFFFWMNQPVIWIL